jgi:hypothetical protein
VPLRRDQDLLDLKAQYRRIKPEVDAAILRAIESTQFVLGPEVVEKRFADYCNVGHCLAVNSGTSALHLALLAAGVGPGDEVITVSMTFVATTPLCFASTGKAERLVGFRATVPLERGLADLVKWWRIERESFPAVRQRGATSS